MKTNPLEQYGIRAELPQVFDHTFTGTFIECQRMALYQTIWGRRGRGEDYNLVWGQVFHKLAELWTQHGDINEVVQVIDLNIPEEVDDRYGRNRRKMQDLFLEWTRFRVADPIEILRTEQPAVVTCISRCPYSDTGCNLTYGGRLDQIVRWQALVGPLDFKTTVMDEDDPITEYKPNHQMAGYVWLTTHLMGKHCWGPIIERLIANKSKLHIDRFPIPYPRGMILEWVENERRTHTEIRSKAELHPYDEIEWRQNWARCKKPYPCRFRDVCTSPLEAGFRHRWLRDNTTESRFNFQQTEEPSNV